MLADIKLTASKIYFKHYYSFICFLTFIDNIHSFIHSYIIPKIRKDVFKLSFFPCTIKEWNLLPSEVVNSDCIDQFKDKLCNFFNKYVSIVRFLDLGIYFYIHIYIYIYIYL